MHQAQHKLIQRDIIMCTMHNADDVLDWMVNKELQPKLDSVILTSPVKVFHSLS